MFVYVKTMCVILNLAQSSLPNIPSPIIHKTSKQNPSSVSTLPFIFRPKQNPIPLLQSSIPISLDHENSNSFTPSIHFPSDSSPSSSCKWPVHRQPRYNRKNRTKFKKLFIIISIVAPFGSYSSVCGIWQHQVWSNSKCFSFTCPRRTKPASQLIR